MVKYFGEVGEGDTLKVGLLDLEILSLNDPEHSEYKVAVLDRLHIVVYDGTGRPMDCYFMGDEGNLKKIGKPVKLPPEEIEGLMESFISE